MASEKGNETPEGSAAPVRKLRAQTYLSMDGVMQAPGGQEAEMDSGYAHTGWSMSYWDETMGRLQAELMSQPADVILGRKTYDLFASFWPKHRDMPGSELNQATKYVASRTRKKLDWENSHLLQGDVVTAIRELKRRPGPPLHVVGSADLLQTLLKNDLVDELDLWVFPVVLGGGKRLFAEGAIPTAWKLTSSQASGTGVLIQHYERAGEVAYVRFPAA